MQVCRGVSSPLKSCLSTIWRTPLYNNILGRSFATEAQPNSLNEAFARSSSLFKTYKPITPSIRHLKRPINDHLWKGRPLKLLTLPLRKKGGRNNRGRITVRWRGGGHKQRIRIVDFMRTDAGPQDIVRIEYDPCRSAHIALVRSRDPNANNGKRFSYILATDGMRAGDVVESFRNGIPDGLIPGYVDKPNEKRAKLETDGTSSSDSSFSLGVLRARTLKPGNVLPLRLIPAGTVINSVSLKPDGKALLVRSAGSYAQVITHEEDGRYVQVKLQSGEVRRVLRSCCATIGKVSNPLWRYRVLGKAGRSRWLGRRPHVRGVAMNR